MMAKQSPDRLAVTDRTAATTLPGGIARWRVADLVAIIDGFAAKPEEEKFEL